MRLDTGTPQRRKKKSSVCKVKKILNKNNVSDLKKFIDGLSQHDQLKILTGSSQQLAALPKTFYKKFLMPHKSEHYFFLFNEQDPAKHQLDLQDIYLSTGELLFVVPNQIHTSPALKKGLKFSALSFEPRCLALLPRQFSFLSIRSTGKLLLLTTNQDKE